MCNNTEGTRQNMLTPQHLRVKSMTFLLGSSDIHSTDLNPTSIQQFRDKGAKNNVGKAKVRGGESPARHADTRANRVTTELNTLGSESHLITVCAVCLWRPLLWQCSVRATRTSPQCHKVYMTTQGKQLVSAAPLWPTNTQSENFRKCCYNNNNNNKKQKNSASHQNN